MTDNGIRDLGSLPNIEYLHLGNTPITDDGLLTLASIPSLKRVDIDIGSGITIQGVHALKAARPTCNIGYSESQANGSGQRVGTK